MYGPTTVRPTIEAADNNDRNLVNHEVADIGTLRQGQVVITSAPRSGTDTTTV